jgi:TPR repeat protein
MRMAAGVRWIYELGLVYEQGLGVTPDFDRAFENYKKAALAGVGAAVNNLASMKASLVAALSWPNHLSPQVRAT